MEVDKREASKIPACSRRWAAKLWPVIVIALLVLGAPQKCNAQKINALLVGSVWGNTLLEKYFDEDPSVEYTGVPCRDGGGIDAQGMVKAVRLYFPRTYEEMKDYDYIMLLAPEFHYFNPKQDLWMHDAIEQGAGGFNDGSVFSIQAVIHNAWAISLTQAAFPNDAPAVVTRGGGGESPVGPHGVVINREFPDPVLTPFIDYGVEDNPGLTSRFIIPRPTAGTLAWMVGNFPTLGKVPFLVVWDYGSGRTMSCGGFIKYKETWFGPENPYGADMVMNMVFYSTQRGLIRDVEIFHHLKLMFREFTDRMNMLIALKDFIEKFSANTQRIQNVILELQDMRRKANEEYLTQDFSGCQDTMSSASRRFDEAEEIAKEARRTALLWVYVIEWLVTSATFLVSSFTLWSLLVRRKLYRQVRTTKFR